MADKKPAAPSKPQTFNMKSSETNTLLVMQSNHQSTFSGVLSLIAQERMGYQITPRTQFKLNAELTTIEISEVAEDVPVAVAPSAPDESPAPETPKSGAVTA